MRLRRQWLASTVLAAGLGPLAAPAGAIQVGQTAPDFELVDVDGQAHRLSDLRGHLVLLAFIGYG